MSSVSYLMKRRHGMQTEVGRTRHPTIMLIRSGIPHRRGSGNLLYLYGERLTYAGTYCTGLLGLERPLLVGKDE